MEANKWLGLALLSAGVGAVQLSGVQLGGQTEVGASRMIGFATILIAAALSSLAGVYFERILKGVKVSLWTRNLQLAAYSIITSIVPLMLSGDLFSIQENGFFHGYTWVTWACIIMNAGGGLLVGTVIKYADAVTKDVAIGASIVISSLVSVHLFAFEVTPLFIAGVSLVIYGVFLYGERVFCFGLMRPPPDGPSV